MPKFSEFPHFALDEYFEDVSFTPDPVSTAFTEFRDEAGADWSPEYHWLSLIDGNAFIRVQGVSLTPYTSASYSMSLHDSAGKTATGWIEYTDVAENLGGELVTDGGFAASASWNTGGSWAVSGGKANFSSSVGGSVWQYVTLTAGKLYKLQYTIDSASVDMIYAVHQGDWFESRSGSGTYTEYFTAIQTESTAVLGIYARNGSAVADNISLKEVLDVGTDGVHIVSTDGGATRNWTSIESGFDYNDDTYTLEVYGQQSQTDATLIGDRHSIIVDGGYWTKLYVDIDDELTEVKFRSGQTEWVDSNGYFIFTKDPSGADFSNGADVYFRKDSYLHSYFRTLAETDDTYEHYLNLRKPFAYFGKIYLNEIATREYKIEWYGMKDFVADALPEHNRTDKLIEYLDLYYDRTHSEIYAMLKNVIILIDPKEVDIDFLDYIADMYSVTISEALSANQWVLTESQEREFVARIIYWLKRKGTYSAIYILWKLLVGLTSNDLNIYERWHDGATPGPPSFASFVDYLYTTYYGDIVGGEFVLNGGMEIDDYWDDFNSPSYNIRSSDQAYGGSYSRKFAASEKDDGIQSQGFSTVLNEIYRCSAQVFPHLTGSAKIHLTTGSGTGEVFSQEYSDLTPSTWNYISVSGAQSSPGDSTKVVISQIGGDERVTGDNSDFDTIGDWLDYEGNGDVSSVAGGNPGNCMRILNDSGLPTRITAALGFSSPLSAGTYTLTFDAKNDGVMTEDVRWVFQGTGIIYQYDIELTSSWQTFEYEVVVPDGWIETSIWLNTMGFNNNGEYWLVDNFSITENPNANAAIYVDNVSVLAGNAPPTYPADYDGYGDNWTLSPHYKIEVDMTNEPFGDDYIIDEPTLYNLLKYWEMVRPISKVSHYLEYISPTADFTGYWNSLYAEEYKAAFETIMLDPPLDPVVGTDFYLQTVASDSWTATHDLGSTNVLVQCFDRDDERIIAEEIYPVDSGSIQVDLAAANSGIVYMALSTATVSAAPSAAWNIAHNQGTEIITYFTDMNRYRIYPETVTLTDSNNLRATFSEAVSGYCFTRARDYKYTQTSPSYSWTVQHDLDVDGVMVNFYNISNEKIYPDIIELTSLDYLTASFSTPTSGYAAVVAVGAPSTQGSVWTPLTSGYIKLGNGSDVDVWNPWSANDLKNPIVTIANSYITYTDSGIHYSVSFELPLTAIDGNITEVGLFNVSDELVFYSYCDPLFKASEWGLRMHYRIEK
jgi:hypothetical protein